jgi:hypothetical protein
MKNEKMIFNEVCFIGYGLYFAFTNIKKNFKSKITPNPPENSGYALNKRFGQMYLMFYMAWRFLIPRK